MLASFPGLIAGCHVFHRLSMPRHPPCTLKNFTTPTDSRKLRPALPTRFRGPVILASSSHLHPAGDPGPVTGLGAGLKPGGIELPEPVSRSEKDILPCIRSGRTIRRKGACSNSSAARRKNQNWGSTGRGSTRFKPPSPTPIVNGSQVTRLHVPIQTALHKRPLRPCFKPST